MTGLFRGKGEGDHVCSPDRLLRHVAMAAPPRRTFDGAAAAGADQPGAGDGRLLASNGKDSVGGVAVGARGSPPVPPGEGAVVDPPEVALNVRGFTVTGGALTHFGGKVPPAQLGSKIITSLRRDDLSDFQREQITKLHGSSLELINSFIIHRGLTRQEAVDEAQNVLNRILIGDGPNP